jgi:hypothetical protein
LVLADIQKTKFQPSTSKKLKNKSYFAKIKKLGAFYSNLGANWITNAKRPIFFAKLIFWVYLTP